MEAATGILLRVAAAIALARANSPWADFYHALWHTSLGFTLFALTIVIGVVCGLAAVAFHTAISRRSRRAVHALSPAINEACNTQLRTATI
jgi:NhaA family Na+:H+ antiporter